MVWYFGSHAGSLIKHSWYYSFKTGLKEWPEVYVCCIHFTIAVFGSAYVVTQHMKNNDYVSRYKRAYHVVRPDDPRLQLYPRKYVTDKQYLAPNHPQSTKDCLARLPPVNVHVYDPSLRHGARDAH